jgi:2-oxoisovalerate dehydrogenase E2 component (dihydrolipoyl transacylase)
MPALGESVHEGTIGKWLKQPGDKVERFEAVCEVITDKVNAEIPAEIEGILTQILVQEGQTVEVGTVIGEMELVGATVKPQAEVAAKTAELSTAAAFIQGTTTSTPSAAPAPATTPDYSNVTFPSGRAVVHDDDDDSLDFSASNPAGANRKTAVIPTAATKDLANTNGKPNRYSPAVRHLAAEHHLDLDALNLKGSGLGGRITRDDILNYIETKRQSNIAASVAAPTSNIVTPAASIAPPIPTTPPSMHDQIAANALTANRNIAIPTTTPAQPTQQPTSTAPAPSFSEVGLAAMGANGNGDEFVALTPMRRAIAEHMVRSKHTSPHAWTIVEVDMTKLVKHRAKIKEEFKKREGVDLSYLPFVIQATVKALKQFPQVNATWASDGSGIIIKRDINIGIAVDIQDGLIVPVLHKADEKNLVGLARGLNELVNKARSRKLTVTDVQGGTFTVNNPGAFGSVMSYPIINQPQAAIVTMEAIVKRPVVVTDNEGNETIAIHSMMNMCLSFDHRVIDGAVAGRFLQSIKKQLETLDF